MNVYVFRISYDYEMFNLLKKEIEKGYLRQGWGIEGTNLNKCDEQNFLEAWERAWPGDKDENYKKRKYKNLLIMKDIEEGDYIIIPKLDMNCDYPSSSFTIAKCKEKYRFELTNDKRYIDDFGHIIGIEILFSCPYDYDIDSITISGKFSAYQSALNRVKLNSVKEALERLIKKNQSEPIKSEEKKSQLIPIISDGIVEEYSVFADSVLNALRKLKPNQFEKIIIELFEKNEYELVRRNDYDKLGGDIDITLRPKNKSLLGTIFRNAQNIDNLEINIQAKKKEGKDYNDVKAVNQLVQRSITKGRNGKNEINIVIDLTDEFQSDTEEEASEKNIILIDGILFSSLLIQFGLSGEIGV